MNAGNNEINGKLLNDIDLSNESWTPIGTSDNPFKGVFDGQGHVVTNLHVETTGDYAGFFGYILNEGDDESNGVVKNVGIENSDIKGTKYVGGVVAYNGGSILSVYNAGSVTGSGSGCFTGGVVGYNGRFIAEVYNAGPVESTANDCSTGGVVGRNEKFVYYSYNIGTVGGGANVGGVAGNNGSSIFKAYYNTEVFTGNAVGSGKQPEPAAGKTAVELSSLEIVDLCSDEYHVEQSAWEVGSGRVVMSDNKLVYKLPGLKGFSSQSEIVLMQADNQGVFEIGSAQELKWFAEFASIEKIISISAKLTADICLNACRAGESVLDANGTLNGDAANFEQWTPINIAYGATNVSLDGNGHTISGLYFRNADQENVGFFGKLQGTVSISNLGIVDSYFEGKDSVGVFVGVNDKSDLTITNCFGAGYVKGNDYVAGFIGCTKGGLNIANSYSVSIVNGGNYTGSFIANNALGTIANCFFLNGGSNFGGASKSADEFHDGTVAMLLHNWCEKEKEGSENCKEGGLNGSVWGQDLTKENSLPDFSGVLTSISYPLNFVTFNGDARVYPTEYLKELGLELPTDLERDGYIFLGWSAKEKATSEADFVTSIEKGETGAKTFYAQWMKVNDGVYEIATAVDLYKFAEMVNGGKYTINAKLTANICVNACGEGESVLKADGTLNGDGSKFIQWTPMNVKENVKVTFYGAGHVIGGLYFNDYSGQGVGLFGEVLGTVSIDSLGIVDSYFKVKGAVDHFIGSVGGLVGYASGKNVTLSITNSYNAGEVSGNEESWCVGGLVGYGDATITHCFFLATGKGGYNYGGAETSLDDFHNGTIAKALHDYNKNGVNGSVWGQVVAPRTDGSVDALPVLVLDGSGELIFSIVAKLNGGAAKDALATEYKYGSNYTLPIPERTNYTFGGWFTDAAFTEGSAITEIVPSDFGLKHVYAKWIPLKYTVKVSVNNSTMGSVKGLENSGVYDYGSEVMLEAVAKTGYEFSNWADDVKASAKRTITVTGDISYTANFKAIPSSSSSKIAESSSSSKVEAKSSSSKKSGKSSSSKGADAIVVASSAPHFSVHVDAHRVQIYGAALGTPFAVFDMQGRVIRSGSVNSANYSFMLSSVGTYFIRVGSETKILHIK